VEVVRIERLTKIYGRGHAQTAALVDANLSVEQGELVALLGPSGSGKTTLLTSICCINEPSSGRIELDGTCVYDNGWTGVDVRAFRRQRMGVIFQSYNLIPFLTVLENVELILTLNEIPRAEAQRRAMVTCPAIFVPDEMRENSSKEGFESCQCRGTNRKRS
jgi:putative ABC transport system ATP-binding protein